MISVTRTIRRMVRIASYLLHSSCPAALPCELNGNLSSRDDPAGTSRAIWVTAVMQKLRFLGFTRQRVYHIRRPGNACVGCFLVL